MTISLRWAKALSLAALAAMAACSDTTTEPTRARTLDARFDGKVGSTGNSAKSGSVDARILLDKSGNALLEIRTGTFDDRTNIGIGDGYFQTIQYKVLDGNGKQVAVHNVSLKSSTNRYATLIDLCSNKDDDGDDMWSPGCGTKFGSSWSVSIQANLKGVGGDDKRTDVVRTDATPMYLPDVDLSKQGISVVGQGGALSPATTVTAGTATTFSVAIPNNKPVGGIPNGVGVQTTCVVTVDGWPQLPLPNGQYNKFTNPNAFGYVGSATQNIAAGDVGACQFTLSLPQGTHKIVVTAGVLYPGDYDPSNNSTSSFTVTAGAGQPQPPAQVDIAAQSLQRVGNGVNTTTVIALDTTKVSKVVTIKATFANASSTATAIDCAVNAPNLNPQAVGAVTNVALPANGTAACQYTVSSAAVGSFPISVTATPSASSPQDPSSANNTATGTLNVRTGGAFTDVAGTFNISQDWTNPGSAPAWPIVTTLDHQVFQVSQLSLLVVPTQTILGTFSLSGSVTSGTNGAVSFGTGTVPATSLRAANAGEQVCVTVGPAQSLGNANEDALVYFAQVCAQPAAQAGYQAITVNYTQSVKGSVAGAANPLVFSNAVTMNIALDFTLTGATSADRATATIRVPVTNQATNCSLSFDLTGQSCGTQFGTPVVSTP